MVLIWFRVQVEEGTKALKGKVWGFWPLKLEKFSRNDISTATHRFSSNPLSFIFTSSWSLSPLSYWLKLQVQLHWDAYCLIEHPLYTSSHAWVSCWIFKCLLCYPIRQQRDANKLTREMCRSFQRIRTVNLQFRQQTTGNCRASPTALPDIAFNSHR